MNNILTGENSFFILQVRRIWSHWKKILKSIELKLYEPLLEIE
jgi:hypothetical protein